MTTLLIGTSSGLVILEETHQGNWEFVSRTLDDSWISSINRSTMSRKLLVTTRAGKILKGHLTEGFFEIATLPIRLWFAYESAEGRLWAGGRPVGLYLSEDGGATWSGNNLLHEIGRRWISHSGGPAHLNTFCDRVSTGNGIFVSVEVGGVLKSNDLGHSWEDVTFNLDPDVHKIAFHPKADSTLYASTGSGLFRLKLLSKHWSLLGPPRLKYVQALATHPCGMGVFVSSARSPYGRREEGAFAGNYPGNEFGIWSVSEDGLTWSYELEGLSLSGVLSKSLSIENSSPYRVFAGSTDGSVVSLLRGSSPQIIATGVGQIECLEVFSDES